ncbi:bifunctional serine/threonine-protein kinase/formylglycine-generating enzyme family protein [Hahella chejuensis]|uniref:bifunctional serine/threonine-protein kinase/formylglycine-generating enzyme family protein n=1 Tax=Hahella chejuensis TaxID=158327 RepID=UPI0002E4775D|nr:bifunctional serine/threonine-protein kinase/formylglycine-generating enzyme family protein [Hahella chejuensis]
MITVSPQIPNYEILDEVAEGGMAKVFKARQTLADRIVAIKIISPAICLNKEFRQRFIQEAQITAKLNHPNIIQIYDIAPFEDTFFISMEFMEGGSLTERIRSGRLTRDESTRIILQLAEAMNYAHKLGYIHRDIKPGNILFRADDTPVLSDYGIAKSLYHRGDLTTTGSILGSPPYMSPEQAMGRQLDHRADWYSLGIVFYQMLTGAVPFEATDPISLGIKHKQEPPPPLPSHLRMYQQLMDLLLAKEPERRLSSLDEFRAHLEAIKNVPVDTEATCLFTVESLKTAHGESAAQESPTSTRRTERGGSVSSGVWRALGVVLMIAAVVGYGAYKNMTRPAPTYPFVVVTEPVGATVTFAGEEGAYTPGASLPEGDYEVEVTAKGFWPKTFTLNHSADHRSHYVSLKPAKTAFTVDVTPADAKIRILNIQPKYEEGIPLDPGRYLLEVSAPGYEKLTRWTEISGEQFTEQVFLVEKDALESLNIAFVDIPGGKYRMGFDDGGVLWGGDPGQEVTLAPFKIMAYEVTFEQWDACVADGGCTNKADDRGWGRGRNPVISVSWNDAEEFAAWLSVKTGRSFQLPTEAQWEYAARAGSRKRFSWGDQISHKFANYGKDDCCGGLVNGADKWQFTSPVGSFPANQWGVHDMHGNVWEWVQDCWSESMKGVPADGSARTAGDCRRRVLRGGSWYSPPKSMQLVSRDANGVDVRYQVNGFRLVETPTQAPAAGAATQ